MPRKERTTRPDDGQMDLSMLTGGEDLLELSEEDAQARFAAAAARLEEELTNPDDAAWFDSPYRWVRALPTARKSKVAERLVAGAFAAHGLVPARASGQGHDFTYAGDKYKVRMSTRWASGEYVFQQVTSGDSDLICLLGISPNTVQLWVVEKGVLGAYAAEGTGWLSFPANNPPNWLSDHGGPLSTALEAVHHRHHNG